MTKTYTEQWREGTLKRGYYYYKTKVGAKVIGYQCFGLKFPYNYNHNTIDSVNEVLSPVPSYDEYKCLQEQLKEANEMLKGAKHLTVKDSNGAIMFELVSPEINDYLEKWGVK